MTTLRTFAWIFVLTMLVIPMSVMCGSNLFWFWGPGGGFGKGPKGTYEKHPALYVHPKYFGQTFQEFGGPPYGIPVYKEWVLKTNQSRLVTAAPNQRAF